MALDLALRERLESIVRSDRVLLFMKGTPDAPQCGFSAQVVSILGRLLPSYGSFDVLSDRDVREGVKEFSNWPTIPQLYVDGEFQGGCDIVKELYASGELAQLLGVKPEAPVAPPTVTVTEDAAELLREAIRTQGGDLHVAIDASFKHSLSLGPREAHDIAASSNGVTLLFDRESALRANGLVIGAAESGGRKALTVENPNAPQAATVNQLSAAELRALMESGQEFHLYDVRTPEEHKQAHIAGATLVDPAVAAEIEKLPKDALIVFHCHHGGRSQAAAEHFASRGFANVHNLAGGIDAWSREVDASVPRY